MMMKMKTSIKRENEDEKEEEKEEEKKKKKKKKRNKKRRKKRKKNRKKRKKKKAPRFFETSLNVFQSLPEAQISLFTALRNKDICKPEKFRKCS